MRDPLSEDTASPAARRRRVPRRSALLTAVALAALVGAAYLPALRNDFVNWDDDIYVVNNPAVTARNGWRQIWSTVQLPEHFPNYPLVFTSFWLEYRLWDLDARGYHATNIVLHALNVALVFLFLQALGTAAWVAALAAALFGLHPMQVETVVWVTERKNLLSAFFSLCVFLGYLRYQASRDWRWYYATLLAFVCALLSKTAVVVLPLSLLLLDRFRSGRWSVGSLARVAPMLLLSLVAGLLTLTAESRPLTVPVLARPLLAAACLWFYVGKLLVPVGLLPIYPRWNVSLAQLWWWLPLIGVVAGFFAVRRWLPQWRVRWGLAHFACMLLPVVGLRSFGFNDYSFVADRHIYFASIGLFLAGSVLLNRLRRAAGRSVTVLACLVVVGLAGLTWKQIAVWRNSITLWTDVLANNPDAWFAHNNLGLALADAGRLDAAAHELQTALALVPEDPDAHTNLALVFYRQGNFAAAEQHCREALVMRPNSPELHKDLGLALQSGGKLEAAEAEFRRALALQPDPAYRYLLANVLAARGQVADAIAQLRQVVQHAPDQVQARDALGRALLNADRAPEAADVLAEVVRRRPDSAEAHYNLGVALQRLGRVDEAAQQFEAALKIRPDFAGARDALSALPTQAGAAP